MRLDDAATLLYSESYLASNTGVFVTSTRGKQHSRKLAGSARALVPAAYVALLEDIKARVHVARQRAANAANKELLLLYYSIGLDLFRRKRTEAWGAAIVDRLSRDLCRAFPDMEGFSPRNLRRMRAFYEAYPLTAASLKKWPRTVAKLNLLNWPPAVASLPWAHNVLLLEKCKDRHTRLWYAQEAVQNGWSRDMLLHWISTRLHQRQGRAISNFDSTLPQPQSDLAKQSLKDPYLFNFLSIDEHANELQFESDLLSHITRFLLELGTGFAFVGRQYRLDVDGTDHRVDLLFYHLRLRCYVIIDLKTSEFQPEFAGKMNFYLSAVDALLKTPIDQPSIGLILCRHADHGLTVEYALRDITKPIGVAQWQTTLTESLPKKFRGNLPTVAEIESELAEKLLHSRKQPRLS